MLTSHFAWAIEWLELSIRKLQNDSAHRRQMAENVLEHAIMFVSSLLTKSQALVAYTNYSRSLLK